MTVFFRLLLAIPILILLSLLSSGAGTRGSGDAVGQPESMREFRLGGGAGPFARVTAYRGEPLRAERSGGVAAGGIVVIPTVLMLLFRRKYPRWWFEWNRELYRFGSRVLAYLAVLRDEYPSTDEEQAVHLEIDYPDAQQLNRWLPLVKWLLALPHYIALAFLALLAVLATIASWVAILVTGRHPRGLHEFVVGVIRWGTRVSGYAFLLVTDRYPPFSVQ
jgi:hypothetical protein